MTNDINTLNGSIQEAIDRLVANLQEMGIYDAEYNPDTGLFGLIDMVKMIPPSMTNVEIDTSITCSCPNEASVDVPFDITGVLTATYDDKSSYNVDLVNARLCGATVELYDGERLLGTALTDSNGEYSFSYTPNNTGNLSIMAVYDSSNDYYDDSASSSVSVSVAVEVSSLDLSNDKSVLSFYNGDSATLSAIALDSDGNTIGNRTVTFTVKDGNNITLQTLTGKTDSDGVASVVYESNYYGNVTVKATCQGIESSTINIEDCWYYDNCNSNKGYWSSENELSFNSNGFLLNTLAELDINYPTNCSLEFAISEPTSNPTDWTSRTDCRGCGFVGEGSKSYWYYNSGANYSSKPNTPLKSNVNIKYIVENGTTSSYYNDTLMQTSNTDNTQKFSVNNSPYNTNHLRIKDIKIKTSERLLDVDTVTLSSNKSALSYVDDEVATITATVLDEEDNGLLGQKVTFTIIDEEDNILETGVRRTNDDGVATYNYSSDYRGLITVDAICDDVSATSITIEDYYLCDSMTNANTSKWNYPSEVSHTHSSNGVTLSNTISWEGMELKHSIIASSSIEFEITDVNSNIATGYINIWNTPFSESDNERLIQIHLQNGQIYSDLDNQWINVASQLGVYQFKCYNDKIELYKDGTLLKTVNNVNASTSYIRFTSGKNQGTFTFKDFKIKALERLPIDVELITDKQILSYIDNEEATITATVKNSINKPIKNQEVTFTIINENNDIVETETTITDSLGIATTTYQSEHQGDINIKASCNNVESSSVSIEDCYFYDVGSSSNLSKYDTTYLNGHSVSYDSTESAYKITKGGNNWGSLLVNNLTVPRGVMISFDGKLSNSSSAYHLVHHFGLLDETNHGVAGALTKGHNFNELNLVTAELLSTPAYITQNTNVSFSTNTWYHLELTITSSTLEIKVYSNGSLLYTTTGTNTALTSDTNKVILLEYLVNGTNYFKNLKVKPL